MAVRKQCGFYGMTPTKYSNKLYLNNNYNTFIIILINVKMK